MSTDNAKIITFGFRILASDFVQASAGSERLSLTGDETIARKYSLVEYSGDPTNPRILRTATANSKNRPLNGYALDAFYPRAMCAGAMFASSSNGRRSFRDADAPYLLAVDELFRGTADETNEREGRIIQAVLPDAGCNVAQSSADGFSPRKMPSPSRGMSRNFPGHWMRSLYSCGAWRDLEYDIRCRRW